jgi:thiamine-monophosphate kinase
VNHTDGDGEQAVIRAILDALPTPRDLVVPPGDDAAVLADGLAVTADALVEGVHWDQRLSPDDVGFKALAVSVSDLAATGAQPDWAILALSLPSPLDMDWVRGFARGMAEAAARWSVRVIGGDTTRSRAGRWVSVTLAGRCVAAPLRRSAGRPGDDIWLTGTPGLAGLGWTSSAPPEAALAALRRPDPPLAFALDLTRGGLARAAMDLSDGLALDLPRLCRASRVGAVIDPSAVPRHPLLGADAAALQLGGGEDYQLLFGASPSDAHAIAALAAHHAICATRVGRLTSAEELRWGDAAWPVGGLFHHFEGAS